MSRRKKPRYYPARLNRHIPEFFAPCHPKPVARPVPIPHSRPVYKLLRVETEYFTAGALFLKLAGVWTCEKAAPILRWMVGKSPDFSKVALLKMGAVWEWILPADPANNRLLEVNTETAPQKATQ